MGCYSSAEVCQFPEKQGDDEGEQPVAMIPEANADPTSTRESNQCTQQNQEVASAKTEEGPEVAPVDPAELLIALVERGSPNQCVFTEISTLRSGSPAKLTLQSHPGLAVCRKHAEEKRAGPWRFIEAAGGTEDDAVYVRYDDANYLTLMKNVVDGTLVDQDLVFDVAFCKLEPTTPVNFVGSGEPLHVQTKTGGGARDWLLNDEGTISVKSKPHLVLGLVPPQVPLGLVRRGSRHRCIFANMSALRAGDSCKLTLQSHPGLAICKQYNEERRAGPWRYVESTSGAEQLSISVRYVDSSYLMLMKNSGGVTSEGHEVEQDLVFDVSFGRMHALNTVNFVGSGEPEGVSGVPTKMSGGGRDWTLNQDGTVSAKHEPHLVLGLLSPAAHAEQQGTPMLGRYRWEMDDKLAWPAGCYGKFVTAIDGYVQTSTQELANIGRNVFGDVSLKFDFAHQEAFVTNAVGDLCYPKDGGPGNIVGRCVDFAMPCNVRDDGPIAKLILSNSIGLVRATYFEKCLERTQPFAMRQEIPKEYFWDPEEAVELWERYGRVFFVIVSYSWLSKDHPDPDCYHLKRLVWILQTFRTHAESFGCPGVAVALDFCTLWQKHATYDDRTVEQRDDFGAGLGGFNYMYAHPHISSIKIYDVPESEPRKYDDRGWTLCEASLMDAKPGYKNRFVFEGMSAWLHSNPDWDKIVHKHGCGSDRPPLTPDKFNGQLEQRRKRVEQRGLPLFTCGSDNNFVPKKYAECFAHLKESNHLGYALSNWGMEEVETLCTFLPETKVEYLTLMHQRPNFTDDCLHALVLILPKCPRLQSLYLVNCGPVTDGAIKLLQDAWIKAGKLPERLRADNMFMQ